ncbi:MAG: UDP-N-acetylglucosamine 1-carboxyvinyltransferase [Candidatus Magasanikbacteria bacterium]|nr:UDP-N-acetylglucosamine 1-carboxyvinyltransferase [Candidatus Magasanikbacteria bacterium]
MAQFKIQGQIPLSGKISVSGAKNAALKAIAASLLSPQPLKITNFPFVHDVRSMLAVLETIGARITRGDHEVTIDTSNVASGNLLDAAARKIRTTTLLIGPLLHRFGEVQMGFPGGCVIGRRPIDIFINGYRALGVQVDEDDGERFIFKGKVTGGEFFFPQVSVTATESLLLAACVGVGRTILKNVAMEPEIPALAEYLSAHNAKISGAGTASIIIEGVPEITAGEYKIIPDRVEAGSFLIMAAAARAELIVENCQPEHLESLLATFDQIGVPYTRRQTSVAVHKNDRTFASANIKTHEYPGFITDLQAPMTVFLTQCQGQSLVHETIFEGRLFYIDLLNRMGANILLCDPHRALVQGPSRLRGKIIDSPDIRAGMAMVIAGLIARGETIIGNIEQIDRGYEALDERLRRIGAEITRV